MKDILVLLGFLILLIWGSYDYLKILFLMKKYSDENIKIVFTGSVWRYILLFCGVCLGIVCMIYGFVHSKDISILLGATCFSALSRDFCHSYIGVMEKGIIMNGRLIGFTEVRKYGSVYSLVVLNFVNILDVCTSEYREYVYVKKGYDIRNISGKKIDY